MKVYNYGLHDPDGIARYSWMPTVKNAYEYSSVRTASVINAGYFSKIKLEWTVK